MNVTVPEGCVCGSTFQFVPPAAAPAPVAVLAPSSVPIPQMQELQRDENIFDEKNGQCYDWVKTVHKFDWSELVDRNVQLTDGLRVPGRGVHFFGGGCSDGWRVFGRAIPTL